MRPHVYYIVYCELTNYRLCFPKTVQIAVSVNFLHGLAGGQREFRLRLVSGFEILSLNSLIGLDGDPLDIVRFGHRMFRGTNLDKDFAIFGLIHRHMFLSRAVRGAGNQLFHGLAAANTATRDHFQDRAAMFTFINIHAVSF